MRKAHTRLVAFLIALTLSFSLFSLLPVGAAVDEELFIFDALQDAQDVEYPASSEPLLLLLDGQATFTTVGLSLLGGDTNALYISLINQSNATRIRVSYTYEIYGVPAAESVEHALDAQSNEKQAFVLKAPHIGAKNAVKELSISFLGEGALSGNVTLNAMFNISSYVQELDTEATFSRCHYNANEGEIQIDGSLSYAATVRYEGESLALFALAEGEDLHLSSKTPVARTNISFNFSFTVEAQGSDALFSRYVVAAVTAKGERIPLCVPTYPSLDSAEIPREQGFKGFMGGTPAQTVEVTPDVCVVDVYLNRLLSVQSDGVLYAGEYDYYYFDQGYLDELDGKIQNLVGLGSHVYLRLLLDGTSTGLSFVDEAIDGVRYRLPAIRTKQAQRDLFAIIDFVSARYAKGNAISGLVLGRAADLWQTYSYCAAANLAEYSTLYAAALNLVSGAARKNIPSLRVMIPLSDRVFGESITSLQATKDHYSALFLPSLMAALEAQVLSPQPFGIFLESATLTDRVGGENETFYGTDRLQSLLFDLQSAAKKSPYLQTDLFFSWQPPASADESALRADYLLKYAAIFQNGTVSTFLLDLGEYKGSKEGAVALVHMTKYINTDRYDDFCATALNSIGLDSITEAYPSLQGASFRARRILGAALTTQGYSHIQAVTGSYTLWDFSSATDTLGWYKGNGCTALSVISRENEAHVLHAACKTEGDYAEIAYHFDSPVDLSFAPLWQTTLTVSGTQGTRYELQLRLIGEHITAYASAVLTAGEPQTFYLDLLQSAAALADLRNVRVMVRPLDTQSANFELSLSQITIESNTLSSAALAERVSEIRQSVAQDKQDAPLKKDYTAPILITGGIVILSAAIVVIFAVTNRLKYKNQKVAKKDNRKE